MKSIFIFLFFFLAIHSFAQDQSPSYSRTTLFDNQWRFSKDSVSGAETRDYNDANWRVVHLPHDWSIEDLPNQQEDSVTGPFTKASIGATATGFVLGGTAWYRKQFTLNSADQKKVVSICFDGVYMDSEVWINGHYLGSHPYGYTSFFYDLTPYLKATWQQNILAVKVRNGGRNSRWYSGSGIYRHVWLTVANPLHVAQWGVYITTPEVSPSKALVRIVTTVQNTTHTAGHVILRTKLIGPGGKIVAIANSDALLSPSADNELVQQLRLKNPLLWSVETPRLYTAVTQIIRNNKIIDSVTNTFGVRVIKVDAVTGLTINGKAMLLKGGCIHHDNGPLGSATFDRAEERKIELLKMNGFNAIRTSHNPPSKQLLEACDRLGMLVIDEAFDMWEHPKNPEDYHLYFDQWWKRDLTALILRDRNHPAVICWSIGNEIFERADSSGLQIENRLVESVHELDKTRPVTEALCEFWEHKGKTWDSSASAFELLDVGGYNYQWKQYESDHQKYPGRIMMGTESFAREAFENWQQVMKHPYVIGDFVWTAFDYMGEAAIGHTVLNIDKDTTTLGWPWFNGWCGDIDLIGYKKPQSYYRDVIWGRSKIEMAVHRPLPDSVREIVSNWGWPDELQSWSWPGYQSKPLQVRVFSKAALVRLYLNGQLVGEHKISDTSLPIAFFSVPYEAGTLKAVAIENGKQTGSIVLKTAGQAKRIHLFADRANIKADPNDLSYITSELVDSSGTIVQNADVPVTFSVRGAGELIAAGNANPVGMSSFQQGVKHTFRGRCLAIVRANEKSGRIIITACAPGLGVSEITVATK